MAEDTTTRGTLWRRKGGKRSVGSLSPASQSLTSWIWRSAKRTVVAHAPAAKTPTDVTTSTHREMKRRGVLKACNLSPVPRATAWKKAANRNPCNARNQVVRALTNASSRWTCSNAKSYFSFSDRVSDNDLSSHRVADLPGTPRVRPARTRCLSHFVVHGSQTRPPRGSTRRAARSTASVRRARSRAPRLRECALQPCG